MKLAQPLSSLFVQHLPNGIGPWSVTQSPDFGQNTYVVLPLQWFSYRTSNDISGSCIMKLPFQFCKPQPSHLISSAWFSYFETLPLLSIRRSDIMQYRHCCYHIPSLELQHFITVNYWYIKYALFIRLEDSVSVYWSGWCKTSFNSHWRSGWVKAFHLVAEVLFIYPWESLLQTRDGAIIS